MSGACDRVIPLHSWLLRGIDTALPFHSSYLDITLGGPYGLSSRSSYSSTHTDRILPAPHYPISHLPSTTIIMAWVNCHWDKNSTAQNCRNQEAYLKEQPDLWTRLHESSALGKRKRSDELAHCMLNYYTDKHHELLEERKQLHKVIKIVDDRNTRLYNANVVKSNRIVDLETMLDDRNRESANLFDAALTMITMLPVERRRAANEAIVNALAPIEEFLADE